MIRSVRRTSIKRLVGALVSFAVIAGPIISASAAQASMSSLAAGESLSPSQYLSSPNGQYRLAMQSDGNLVLYTGQRALWQTQTTASPGARLFMQSTDGNMVMYDTSGRAVWSSNTAGHAGSSLYVQDDGNVVIYSPAGQALWNTGTATAAAGAGVTAQMQAAANWAIAQKGSTFSSYFGHPWSGWCEQFAEQAEGFPARFDSALLAYQWEAGHGRIHNDANPPVGALVFYGGGGGAGHVAVSIGGGQEVGTLGLAGDNRPVSQYPVVGFLSNPYLGWALPIGS